MKMKLELTKSHIKISQPKLSIEQDNPNIPHNRKTHYGIRKHKSILAPKSQMSLVVFKLCALHTVAIFWKTVNHTNILIQSAFYFQSTKEAVVSSASIKVWKRSGLWSPLVTHFAMLYTCDHRLVPNLVLGFFLWRWLLVFLRPRWFWVTARRFGWRIASLKLSRHGWWVLLQRLDVEACGVGAGKRAIGAVAFFGKLLSSSSESLVEYSSSSSSVVFLMLMVLSWALSLLPKKYVQIGLLWK